jgi:hypothetical protein
MTEKQENKRVIRKPVAFNKNDPEQKELLEYALNIENFSGYIKDLIKKDKELKDQLSARSVKVEGKGIKIDLSNQ